MLDERERRVQQVRDSVAEGFAAIERGEGMELTPESMDARIRLPGKTSPPRCLPIGGVASSFRRSADDLDDIVLAWKQRWAMTG